VLKLEQLPQLMVDGVPCPPADVLQRIAQGLSVIDDID
jgi:hypothetical protein